MPRHHDIANIIDQKSINVAKTLSSRQSHHVCYRSRYQIFIKYRDIHGVDHHVITMQTPLHSNVEMKELYPSWLLGIDNIRNNVNQIQTKLDILNQKYMQQRTPSFKASNQNINNEIDQLIINIKSDLNLCIRRCNEFTSYGKQFHDTKALAENIKLALSNLLNECYNTLTALQSDQMGYLSLSKSFVHKDITDSGFDSPDIHDRINQQEMIYYDNSVYSKVRENSQWIQDRESSINEIQQSIVDIAAIMKRLSMDIIDQGTLLDRIDCNIESMHAQTLQSYQALQKGNKSQRKYNATLWIVLLIALIIVTAIGIVIKKTSQ